jgi:diguanylate cyclase (GGDEF)-like protein
VLDLGVPTPLTDAFRLRDVIAVRPATASAQDYPDSAAALIAARVGLLVAAPLVAEGQATGVYHVAFRRPPDRWADDLDLFRTIGVAAGTALERARLHEQLQFRATHDPLTTAANRPLFIERLDRALLDGADRGRPTTVMFMDLDGFKDVNDRFGHRVGDELLVEMVRRLRAALRPGDTVARLGGDEFAVLCADTGAQGADAVARRLEQAVSVPYRSEGGVLSVTASVGITVHDPAQGAGTPTSAQLLKDADAAMYLAKATGKNRHVVYDEELESRLSRRAEVEQLLREALDGDGVVLHFQPVFDLARHVATGVEALCRLRDRDGTLVPPDEFIGIAEERGLIARLGRRILERACAQVAAWDADGARPVTLAVNIAADQAARPDFADEVLAVLEGTGFPADRLLLELTESALLEATDATIDGLRQLRDRGIGIALDDFGTRYASLHYVQQLPLTTLKIDRSFVAPLPGGPAERAIVRSVAALAHELGLRCTAEGIETDEQRQFLADLGVQGQGYLLAVPMDAAGCRAVLDAGD